jgi:hypothetical protein
MSSVVAMDLLPCAGRNLEVHSAIVVGFMGSRQIEIGKRGEPHEGCAKISR